MSLILPYFFIVPLFMTLLVYFVFYLFSFIYSVDYMEGSTFECGFTSYHFSRYSFSIHYFFFAVVFLFLDLEISLIFFFFFFGSFVSFFYVNFFIFLLLFSLYYEWFSGYLDWSF